MVRLKSIVLPAKARLPTIHGHEVISVEAEWYEGTKDCVLYRKADGHWLLVKRDIEGNEKAKVTDSEVARKLIIKAEAQAARDDEADLVDIDADAPA